MPLLGCVTRVCLAGGGGLGFPQDAGALSWGSEGGRPCGSGPHAHAGSACSSCQPHPGPEGDGLALKPLPVQGPRPGSSLSWAPASLTAASFPALCPSSCPQGLAGSRTGVGTFPLSAPAHLSGWPGCSAGLLHLFVLRCSQPIMTHVHQATPPPPGCGSSMFSWDKTRKISNIDF